MTTITIFGRLTKDPEITEKNGTKMARFTVASKAQRNKQTEFFVCSCWNENTVEFMESYLSKGSQICVLGEPVSFDGKNGTKIWYINTQAVEAMKCNQSMKDNASDYNYASLHL